MTANAVVGILQNGRALSVKNVLFPLVMTVLFVLAGMCCAHALEAMPHTNEAVSRLNDAIGKIGEPKIVTENAHQMLKNYIHTYKRIFEVAGFDYERSVMKVVNDIQFDRYRANNAFYTVYGLTRELLRLHVRTNIHPNTYLSKDCAFLLIELRNIIRSNYNRYGGC